MLLRGFTAKRARLRQATPPLHFQISEGDKALEVVEGDRAVNAGRARDLVHAARFSFGVEAKEDVAPGEVAERSKSAVHVGHQVLPGMGPLTGGGAPVGA